MHYFSLNIGIEWLRTRWHLAGGGEIGALPSSPRQNDRLGLPLLLLPEEVSLLLDKGWYTVMSLFLHAR